MKEASIESCRIDHIEIYSYEDTSPSMAYFMEDVAFTDCDIVCTASSNNTLAFGTGSPSFYQFDGVVFNSCHLSAVAGHYLMDIPVVAENSDMTFTASTLTAASGVDMMRIGGADATVFASGSTFKLSSSKKIAIAGTESGTFYNKTNGGTANNTRDPNPSAPPPTRSLISSDVTCTWAAN